MFGWGSDRGTNKAKGVDGQGADGVGEQAEPEDIKVQQGDAQVPDEIAAGKRLDHARRAGIPPNPLLKVHVLALFVDKHGPQGEAIDQHALDERDDVGVPVGLLGAAVLRVVLGEEEVGDKGRDGNMDEGVEGGGAEDLVDVQRQGGKREQLGQGLDGLAQRLDRREGERIAHLVVIHGSVLFVVVLQGGKRDSEGFVFCSAF